MMSAAIIALLKRPISLPRQGARAAETPAELIAMLDAPRLVWLMLPSGAATREHIEIFARLLSAGDILVDGSNSSFKDDEVHRSYPAEEKYPLS